LETFAGLDHHFGMTAQPLDRTWVCPTVGIITAIAGTWLVVPPTCVALLMHLGEVAQRGLEGRPVFLLIGRQPQPRLQCGDTRIGEGRAVFLR
jgi:hypothetical protein